MELVWSGSFYEVTKIEVKVEGDKGGSKWRSNTPKDCFVSKNRGQN